MFSVQEYIFYASVWYTHKFQVDSTLGSLMAHSRAWDVGQYLHMTLHVYMNIQFEGLWFHLQIVHLTIFSVWQFYWWAFAISLWSWECRNNSVWISSTQFWERRVCVIIISVASHQLECIIRYSPALPSNALACYLSHSFSCKLYAGKRWKRDGNPSVFWYVAIKHFISYSSCAIEQWKAQCACCV